MSIKGIYDIHCHIVPGVDDGATDIGETVKLLRMEYEQGVRTVITTPHFRFRMFETPAEKVREQFRLVEKAASEISPDLHVYLGCEFHANMEMLPMLREQKVMTMAGSRYVLTEFSHNSEESYIRERLGALLSGGYKPIMAHIERYEATRNSLDFVEELADMGVYMQINADSMGYTNITVVKEQEQPDGHFPTCPYPNPEIKEAMALGMEYARKCNADLLLATDPDCDRVGIAVKNKAGEYELLTGNQTGMLLLDYICSQRIKHGKMPADPVMIKTIVTMDMGEQIAAHYGLRTVNVLTGFKFIGEQIGKLEQLGKADSYVFGFEESYGYLTGSYVRDKDGVDGAYMICEMFSYYATRGISLLDKLDELYKTYGYCLNTLHSYEFDGSAGFARMQSIMQAFRGGIKEFGGKKVVRLLDYVQGLDGLPKSDVLKFLLEDNCSLVVRPSGTEPKLKIYISVSAENKEMAEEVEDEIAKTAEKWIC